MTKRIAAVIGGAAGVAALAVGIGSGAATAAPIPVYQVPATGTSISGLVVPSPWFVNVAAGTTGAPGEVALSTPTAPNLCAGSAVGALIRIDYINLSRGNTGSVLVKPCANFLDPASTVAIARTGSGQIAFATNIVGSGYKPQAGQPALPGGGTLNVP